MKGLILVGALVLSFWANAAWKFYPPMASNKAVKTVKTEETQIWRGKKIKPTQELSTWKRKGTILIPGQEQAESEREEKTIKP